MESPRPRSGTGRRFSGIGVAQCRQLLAANDIGRIAWHDSVGVQLLPVSYVWADDAIYIRTSPSTTLGGLTEPTDVVFEVDDLDARMRTGWSIIVRGRLSRVDSLDPASRVLSLDGPVPWASGANDLILQVTPSQITGRRLRRDADDRSGFERDRR